MRTGELFLPRFAFVSRTVVEAMPMILRIMSDSITVDRLLIDALLETNFRALAAAEPEVGAGWLGLSRRRPALQRPAAR